MMKPPGSVTVPPVWTTAAYALEVLPTIKLSNVVADVVILAGDAIVSVAPGAVEPPTMTLNAEVAVLMVVLVVTISSCAVAGHATAARNAAIRKEFVRIMFVDFAFTIVAPRKGLLSRLDISRPAN